MSIYTDAHEWDIAHADFVSDEGANASDRVIRRMAAAERMCAIEGRYEDLPGGFLAERVRAEDHVKRVVDGWPPLTAGQRSQLAPLLEPKNPT